jgi:hypothetical protein
MFKKQHEPTDGIRITIDGVTVAAAPNETVAAVLLRTPPFFARTTALTGAHRGPYCMMGVCFDCLAVVDGVPSTQTCLIQVRDGMRVERQRGTGRSAA